MDDLQQTIIFPAFFTFLLFIFILKTKSKTASQKLPPGPWKLPIIGNIHQLLGPLPHRTLRDLSKQYGPMMHLKLGNVSSIVISSPEAAKQVMKTHDIVFAQRPYVFTADVLMYNRNGIAFAPYGESWRQMRKICTLELLGAKRVRSFRAIREEEVSKMIRSILNSSEVNITKALFSLSNATTLRSACGKAFLDPEVFWPILREMMNLLGGFGIIDSFPSLKFLYGLTGMRSKMENLHQKADVILENIIREHRKNKTTGKEDDLVDVLLNFQEHNNLGFSLTQEHIKATMLDIFIGGIETSATTVDWAMVELQKNPSAMKKAQEEVRRVFNHEKNTISETRFDELKYLKLIIKETLRLHPPGAFLIPRECQEAVEVDGYLIPPNTKVMINVWAIGRDNNCWVEAERFYPERFENNCLDFKGNDFELIPFGAGRRMCPGMTFAMGIIELALANLLYHFDWKLPHGMEPDQLDVDETFGLSVRRKNDLYLIPIPYDPPASQS